MPTWTLPLLFILCACRSPAVDSGPGQDSDGPPHDTGAGEPVFSGDYPVEQASVRLYASEPQQHAGRVLASGDVDGDGAEELLVTTVRDDDYEGGAWLLSALPEGQGSLEEHGLRLEGSGSTLGAGRAASLGDTDGDGLADLLISAPYPGSDALLLLAAPFEQDLELAEAGTRLAGEDGGTTGHDAQLVDLDGDGLCDVVAGAPGGFGSSDAGAVFLVHAPIAEGTTSLALEARATLAGAEPGDGAGRTLRAGGDVDGDGLADLLVGAYGHDAAGQASGAAYLLPSGSIMAMDGADLSAAAHRFHGEAAGDTAGFAVSGAGDVDGDGLSDLLIGADCAGDAGELSGKAYLILGGGLGATTWASLAVADAELIGEEPGDRAGVALGGAGDVDGDGRADVLVGACYSGQSASNGGKAYLMLGDALAEGGSISLAGARYAWVGTATGDLAGRSVTGGAFLDDDIIPDLLIGATHTNGGGENDVGKAYAIFGDGLIGG